MIGNHRSVAAALLGIGNVVVLGPSTKAHDLVRLVREAIRDDKVLLVVGVDDFDLQAVVAKLGERKPLDFKFTVPMCSSMDYKEFQKPDSGWIPNHGQPGLAVETAQEMTNLITAVLLAPYLFYWRVKESMHGPDCWVNTWKCSLPTTRS